MLISAKAKQKCDAYGCKNDASVFFAVKGRIGRCYLCGDCIRKLAAEAMGGVPKSPQNTIKRLSEKREKEANGGGTQ